MIVANLRRQSRNPHFPLVHNRTVSRLRQGAARWNHAAGRPGRIIPERSRSSWHPRYPARLSRPPLRPFVAPSISSTLPQSASAAKPPPLRGDAPRPPIMDDPSPPLASPPRRQIQKIWRWNWRPPPPRAAQVGQARRQRVCRVAATHPPAPTRAGPIVDANARQARRGRGAPQASLDGAPCRAPPPVRGRQRGPPRSSAGGPPTRW